MKGKYQIVNRVSKIDLSFSSSESVKNLLINVEQNWGGTQVSMFFG